MWDNWREKNKNLLYQWTLPVGLGFWVAAVLCYCLGVLLLDRGFLLMFPLWLVVGLIIMILPPEEPDDWDA